MNKNNKTKNQTKAGLLNKNGKDNQDVKEDVDAPEKTTPKISKGEAEHKETDQPLH